MKKIFVKHSQNYEVWGIDMSTRKQPQSKDGDKVVEQGVDQETTKKPMDVDEAFNILDRVIGFIGSCDNKTSIALGVTAAILTIIFSGDGVEKITEKVSAIMFPLSNSTITVGEIAYLIILLLSVILIAAGLVSLVLTLTARTESVGNSAIYFGHIAQLKDAEAYKERIASTSKEELLEDILTQIYINSTICNKKYKHYNRGLKLTVMGFVMLVVVLVVSVFGR